MFLIYCLQRIFSFNKIRPWAARNHPCGSTSLLLLVTSSVLMVKEWSAKWRDLSNHTRRGTIQSRSTPEKKAKNHVTLTWKFPWKSCSTAHLPFLPSNPKILKPSLKTFPLKWNLLNARQKKKNEARKGKKEVGKVRLCMEWTAYNLVFKLINLHSPCVVYKSSRNHN